MLSTCQHKRLRSILVFLEPDAGDPHRTAVLTIQCRDCAQPFEFGGIHGPGAALSEDRQELRLAIMEVRRGMVQ